MEYNKIISVTGLGGLFELVSSKADGAIVRSLEDGVTKFISSRQHQFSHLESIEIFTTRQDNVNLTEVFAAIKNSSEKLPDYKDAAAVKKYFEKVYPDMDFTRVYASDMKKIVRWWNIIHTKNIDFAAPQNKEINTVADTSETPAIVEEPVAEKPKKKSAPKKKDAEKLKDA